MVWITLIEELPSEKTVESCEMSGEMNLSRLLATMSPTLQDGTYVFVTLSDQNAPANIPTPRMAFQEAEGTTLILLKTQAEAAGLDFEFPSRMITLNVHSALDAVGFLAHITTRLAALGMGVNPVAGFYHDHLFIPEDRANDAMSELNRIISEAQNE